MLSFNFQFKGIQGCAIFDTAKGAYQCVMGSIRFGLDSVPAGSDLYQAIEAARKGSRESSHRNCFGGSFMFT